MNVCVSRRLKEELAWVIDKWLWVINNLKQLYHKENKDYSRFEFKTILYALLCDPY